MSHGSWIELVIRANKREHNQILSKVVRPLFKSAISIGLIKKGYFLRDGKQESSVLRLRLVVVEGFGACLKNMLINLLKLQNFFDGQLEIDLDLDPEFSELEGLWEGTAGSVLRDNFFSDTCFFVLDNIYYDSALLKTITFDLMVSHVHAIKLYLFEQNLSPPYPSSFLSYRSHADGFFIMSKDPTGFQKLFEEHYLKVSQELQARLKSLLSDLDSESPTFFPAARVWHSKIKKFIPPIRDMVANEELKFPAGENLYLGDRFDITVSPFHQAIQKNLQYRHYMQSDTQFKTMRVLFTFLYWTLNQLGLRLIDRYLLCHATSRAFEDVFQIDPAKIMIVQGE